MIKEVGAPDNTAVRVALWRALHVEIDSPPHIFEDEVGLKLAAPDDVWRSRPDMSAFTRPFRASIVARARFIEDLVAEQAARGVGQYVILGAGLDIFAQRRPELASRLFVFARSISPAFSPGSASVSSISVAASRLSYGSCRSTSRRASRGGSCW
jgi:O-methyltransferase involved in polyketide biosynthesis